MKKYDELIDLIENRMSTVPIEGGSITLFEMDSEFDNTESLELIKSYLFDNGYVATFDNSDVYRLMYVKPRE